MANFNGFNAYGHQTAGQNQNGRRRFGGQTGRQNQSHNANARNRFPSGSWNPQAGSFSRPPPNFSVPSSTPPGPPGRFPGPPPPFLPSRTFSRPPPPPGSNPFHLPPPSFTGPPPPFSPAFTGQNGPFSVPPPPFPVPSNTGGPGNSGNVRTNANSGTGQRPVNNVWSDPNLFMPKKSRQRTFPGPQNGSGHRGNSVQSNNFDNSGTAQFGGKRPVNNVWSDSEPNFFMSQKKTFSGSQNLSGNKGQEHGGRSNFGRGQNRKQRRRKRNNNKGNNNNQNNSNQNENDNNSGKKQEQVDKQDVPESKKYNCDVCDRSFKTELKYEEHVGQHTQCWVKGCRYVAAPKLVQLHYNAQHRTGVAKKIWCKDSPEEIKKWIEERKRNFPTKENIARKAEEKAERIRRGEVLEDKNRRFGKMQGGRGGRGRRGRRGHQFRGQNAWGYNLRPGLQSALDTVTEECQSMISSPIKRPRQAEKDDGLNESTAVAPEAKKPKLDDDMKDSTDKEGEESTHTVSSEDTSSDSDSSDSDSDSSSSSSSCGEKTEPVKKECGAGLASLVAAYEDSDKEDGEISDEEACVEVTPNTSLPSSTQEEKEKYSETQDEGKTSEVGTGQQEESSEPQNRDIASMAETSGQQEELAKMQLDCVPSVSRTSPQEKSDETQNGGVVSVAGTCQQEKLGEMQCGAITLEVRASQQEDSSEKQSGGTASQGWTTHQENSRETQRKGRMNGQEREPTWKTKVRRLHNQKYRRNNLMLGTLLKDVIRHERNVVLQCVHYIVKNNFLGILDRKTASSPQAVCETTFETENEQTIRGHSD